MSFADHTVSIVAAVSDQRRGGRPVVGFGFNSIGRFAQGGILRSGSSRSCEAPIPDACWPATAGRSIRRRWRRR
ncbi:MAG: hypothetical protein R2699_11825 [Acidimicrobiales bacterium]